MSQLQDMKDQKNISERDLAKNLGLSRSTVRKILKSPSTAKISTLTEIVSFFDHSFFWALLPLDQPSSEDSIVAVSIYLKENPDDWKIPVFNFVDSFRRSQDLRLVILPPVLGIDPKLDALLHSLVLELCYRMDLPCPQWAKRICFLKKPWFVSGMESLKASAILESPQSFRQNNIFVLSNFLDRV